MQRYFIYLKYDGSNYHGWQMQPNAPSVQEELQKAFYEISAKLYQAAQAEQAAQGGAQTGHTVNEDGTVNTDATEVDDNK